MSCSYIKEDKTACQSNAMTDSKYCFSHNPGVAEKRHEAVVNGGKASTPTKSGIPLEPLKLQSLHDIECLLEDTINRIRVTPMTTREANCVGYLANIFIKAMEVGKLEERLSALERVQKENTHSNSY